MSDTDDTDDLLLIPPDFFHIDAEILDHPVYGENSVGPYYEIVDNLIEQVVKLEDRIYFIENSSFTSTPDGSLESPPKKMDQTRQFRKYNSYDDLYYPKSPVKTPQRAKYRHLQSLPASPQVYYLKNEKMRSPRSVSSPRPVSLLTDSFQSNVKTLQRRTNLARNLDNDFSPTKGEEAINKLCKTIDEQQKRLEVKETEIFGKERTWCSGETEQSVPDYGMGVKNLLYSEKSPRQALNAVNLHKDAMNHSSSSEEEGIKCKKTDLNQFASEMGLLSLTDIWKKSNDVPDAKSLLQKLEEEKFRRLHCEELIKELQNRNLELQEKVAVAIKVDESKNQVISQFQDALSKTANRLNSFSKEKGVWEEEIAKIQKNCDDKVSDANEKAVNFEKEARIAINLAHDSQEKLDKLESECVTLRNDLKSFEERFKEVQEKCKNEVEKSTKLLDLLKKREEEMSATKFALNDIKAEAGKYEKTIQDNHLLKNQVQQLNKMVNENENEKFALNNENQKLLTEIHSLKSQERVFEEKLATMRTQLENSKRELKNFYQGQVELLVESKLKEYQAKLDEAEVNFKEEIKKRDLSMARTAAQHIKQISEKYLLEIKLMEEKHDEEKRLYNIQLMQLRQKNDEQTKHLEQIQEKRVHLAKQLQRMMESQWNEAMRILVNGKTPTFPMERHETADKTLDQLNSLKTQSYNSLEEVFSKDLLNVKKLVGNRSDLQENGITETPTTSRQANKRHESEDLQKYIDLLLNKSEEGEKNFEMDNQNKPNEKLVQKEKRTLKPAWK